MYRADIRFAYIQAGFQDPCCFINGQPFLRLQTVLKAVKKSLDNVVKPRLPITTEMLSKMCNVLRSRFLGTYEYLVLETTFSLAFFGFLRCGEFTSRSYTFDPLTYLSIGDIQFYIHKRYFTLQLKRSKKDRFRKGVTLKYFATKQNICPFQTMMALQQTRNAHASHMTLCLLF